MTDLGSLSFRELTSLMEQLNEKKFRTTQVYEWIHKKLASSYDEMTNIPKSLKEKLAGAVSVQDAVWLMEADRQIVLLLLWMRRKKLFFAC